MKTKTVRTGWYAFSLLTWSGTIILTILSLLFDVPQWWVAGSFLCVVIQMVLPPSNDDSVGLPHTGQRRHWFDRCLIVATYASVSLFLWVLLSLIFAGGIPKMVDGNHCLVLIGRRRLARKEISEGWFTYLGFCKSTFFAFASIAASTIMLRRSRTRYLIGKSNE